MSHRPIRSLLGAISLLGAGLALASVTAGCNALTEPNSITITKDSTQGDAPAKVAAKPADAKPAAPGMAVPAKAPGPNGAGANEGAPAAPGAMRPAVAPAAMKVQPAAQPGSCGG